MIDKRGLYVIIRCLAIPLEKICELAIKEFVAKYRFAYTRRIKNKSLLLEIKEKYRSNFYGLLFLIKILLAAELEKIAFNAKTNRIKRNNRTRP